MWGHLAHELGTRMLPCLAGGTNFAFTIVTLTRLVYLHHWLRAQRRKGWPRDSPGERLMLFASIEEVSLPARLCKVDFALDKVAPGRYAAAVFKR